MGVKDVIWGICGSGSGSGSSANTEKVNISESMRIKMAKYAIFFMGDR